MVIISCIATTRACGLPETLSPETNHGETKLPHVLGLFRLGLSPLGSFYKLVEMEQRNVALIGTLLSVEWGTFFPL